MLVTSIIIIFEILIFFIAVFGVNYLYNHFKDNKTINFNNYLPDDEIHSLRQIFYLIIMAACFINFFYTLISAEINDVFYLAIFDCILSVYCSLNFYKKDKKNIFALILLVPLGSLSYLIFHNILFISLDLIHVPIFLYLVKVYYDKFNKYTKSNGLGVTILLLFLVVFISFIITSYVENVSLLDALVMSSNAFTSNGYAILGNTIIGKIDAIILVWSGYILSGVGTATLTAAILLKHFNKRFNELEKLIKEDKKE